MLLFCDRSLKLLVLVAVEAVIFQKWKCVARTAGLVRARNSGTVVLCLSLWNTNSGLNAVVCRSPSQRRLQNPARTRGLVQVCRPLVSLGLTLVVGVALIALVDVPLSPVGLVSYFLGLLLFLFSSSFASARLRFIGPWSASVTPGLACDPFSGQSSRKPKVDGQKGKRTAQNRKSTWRCGNAGACPQRAMGRRRFSRARIQLGLSTT